MNHMFCHNCKDQEGVLEEVNSLVSPDKRIKNKNVFWNFNYGLELNQEVELLDCDATPSTYLAGTLLEGFGGREYFKSFLKGYLEGKGDIKKTFFDEHYDL